MSEELKACPFCGNAPNISIGSSIISIVCDECGYEFAYATHEVNDAIKEYNTRPIEDALRAKLELANKRINNLRNALQYIGYPSNEWDDPSDTAINALDDDNALQKLEE